MRLVERVLSVLRVLLPDQVQQARLQSQAQDVAVLGRPTRLEPERVEVVLLPVQVMIPRRHS